MGTMIVAVTFAAGLMWIAKGRVKNDTQVFSRTIRGIELALIEMEKIAAGVEELQRNMVHPHHGILLCNKKE